MAMEVLYFVVIMPLNQPLWLFDKNIFQEQLVYTTCYYHPGMFCAEGIDRYFTSRSQYCIRSRRVQNSTARLLTWINFNPSMDRQSQAS